MGAASCSRRGVPACLMDGGAGRKALAEDQGRSAMPLALFIASTAGETRVPGDAVYLSRRADSVPTAMLHSAKHYHVLHTRNIVLIVNTLRSPRLSGTPRAEVTAIGHGFYQVVMNFGFFEPQDVPSALYQCRFDGQILDAAETSFFMSRVDVVGANGDEKRVNNLFRIIFTLLHRNESDATEYFDLPRNRVVELGARVVM